MVEQETIVTTKVYFVIGEWGEYSGYHWWPVAAYLDEQEAQKRVDACQEYATSYQKADQEWADQYWRLRYEDSKDAADEFEQKNPRPILNNPHDSGMAANRDNQYSECTYSYEAIDLV